MGIITVNINIANIGSDTGPFDVYDNYNGLILTNVPLQNIQSGINVDVNEIATEITVVSKGICNNSISIHIQQEPLPFVSKWNTSNTSESSSDANQIKLPLISQGIYDFNIDWGDGIINNITSWNQPETIHTYNTPGEYTITITGDIKGWVFGSTGDKLKIINISSWGSLNLGNVSTGYFSGCENLNLSNVSDILNLSEVNTLWSMFTGCQSITTINRIEEWDMSQITDINTMFAFCTSFNQSLDNWDVSSVTSMNSTFADCINYNQPLNNWDVSNVTSMVALFYNCINFNQPLDNWDVSNVVAMDGMFALCTSFNQSLDNWDVSSVTSMNSTFADCINYNQPLNNWDVSNVTDMDMMFSGATSFNQPLDNWDVSSILRMIDFMKEKSSDNYNTEYLDSIYNSWSQLTLIPFVSLDFGSINYTTVGEVGKNIMTSSPKNWYITDGGII